MALSHIFVLATQINCKCHGADSRSLSNGGRGLDYSLSPNRIKLELEKGNDKYKFNSINIYGIYYKF